MKKLFLIVMILFCSISLTACGVKEDMLDISFDQKGNEVELKQYDTENPVVAMYIEDYGTIVMELYPEIAPNTVNNFISLVKSGFYDNNTFHRLVPGLCYREEIQMEWELEDLDIRLKENLVKMDLKTI